MTSSLPAAVHGYKLCQQCTVRQGGEPGDFEVVSGDSCFVCRGLMDRVPSMAKEALRRVRRYDYSTFSVGVSLPEGVQEREDELRSELKLKGSETIRTQAAKAVAVLMSAATRKHVDKLKPDLTVLVDFTADEVHVSSRPAFFYGRYTKPPGVSQRRELCHHCSGSGCSKCRNTGFERRPSVESELQRKLGSYSGSEKVVFTWLGSEDRESRVYPPGRPFVAEVKNPVKRRFPRRFAARFRGGQVAVSSGRTLPSKPVGLPKFRFRTKIYGVSSSKVDGGRLDELKKRFRKISVDFDRPHDRSTTKTVYRATGRAAGRRIVIDAELDGGLPVKRFVSGELVSPSVSEVLGTQVFCRSFDILGVTQLGELRF
ncbi:MAG: hypothetical protein HY297_01790 [Thaumarchaeota archaeon]|nr:hypothetical protein [Nitrososphaerota archaeon]